MTYTEEDLLPLSGLQHLVFCERQWALIHLEQQWAENRLTAEGRITHDRSHRDEVELRGDLRIVRGLRIHSLKLGLVGMADVVEFSRTSEIPSIDSSTEAVRIPGVKGLWRPFPVEYKRGRPKPDNCDKVQLCAQAMCLEEMLSITVSTGAVFYGQPRRRLDVEFDGDLRAETEEYSAQMHELYNSGRTPAVAYEKKCSSCSLLELCIPKVTASAHRSQRYIESALKELGLTGNSDGRGTPK
ncbi:MAG: CRISPR-associated protein Cas4 [candidate division Zixibacteria bacterium]|nr:CRISPR-associated protein Cas4 [candidate division Zixibacteria bacterium]MBU1471515.1 CRISPR-associated protein Cas4 [candidate division Zixibacteria bacterium]MBU2626546.1 CRISPR-associated protein Cas4 [candidate division Zixibacteria bacterium]